MATRSTTNSTANSPRSKKSSAPIPSPSPFVGREDEQPASGATPADTAGTEVTITTARLEQREIPSFSESREVRIAEAAYWRAERRGFTPGHELEDWLQAEKEIDRNDPRRRQGK